MLVRFTVLLLAGLVVFFVAGYWAGIPQVTRTAIKFAVPILLLLLVWGCDRVPSLRPWRRVVLALLAASSGFLVSWLLADPLLHALGITADSVRGIALTKLTDAVLIVVPLMIVARVGGMSWKELYLCRGKQRLWLMVGIGSFSLFFALFLMQSLDQGLSATRLLALAPWTLIFVFSNAFMEELHFRGLLLRPFEELLGRHGANLCIALFFTLVHAPVQYTPDILPFLTIVFVLALAWGYLIQRSDALWGSVLFHAGADLLIVVGIYQTYGAG